MSLALILACLWIVASAVTAMLPYRMQFPPGIALLILSVPLLIYIGLSHGFIWVGLFLLAIGSMFRNPLIYFIKRLKGRVS
jgi:hypothetical protein